MDERDIPYGVDDGIITISFDALKEAFQKMIDRKLVASVECNPLLAGTAEAVIKDLENGKKVKKKIYTDEAVFTYENAGTSIVNRAY